MIDILEKLGTASGSVGVESGLGADATNAAAVFDAILSAIEAEVPTATPTSIPQAINTLESLDFDGQDVFDSAIALVENGFDPSDLSSIAGGFSAAENSYHNVHPRKPCTPIYPKKSAKDAPYSKSEIALRGAIYIPKTFTFGKKPPVILFPGTGLAGGRTYASNYGRLLADTAFADPVWVNIPKSSLGDAQVTSEFAAYAINYVSGITNRNVSVIAFSQGSLNVQWAMKYWPSARSVTSQAIFFSPDYHGTVNSRVICIQFPEFPRTPGILQQVYSSDFVAALRADGGDSAYVPTTNIFSATDEIVQPQSGSNASGILIDARGVGVSNTEIQSVCPFTPAGSFATHEGMLYNALGNALALDALKNGGPGSVSHLDLKKVCSNFAAPGLSLDDIFAEESGVITFATNFLRYEPKVFQEPAIKAYAQGRAS